MGRDWFAPEEMSDGRRTVKTVFRDPRGEGGDLASTPARAKRLAPRPDGPLTHFTSPRGEKCRLEPHQNVCGQGCSQDRRSVADDGQRNAENFQTQVRRHVAEAVSPMEQGE